MSGDAYDPRLELLAIQVESIVAQCSRPPESLWRRLVRRLKSDFLGKDLKGKAIGGGSNTDEPRSAFLYHLVVTGVARVLEPRVRGPQRGMTGKRQLERGSEDPHAVTRARLGRRPHERGLRQVRPARHALHRVGV